MAIGPSAAQVITQNKTVLQALRPPEQRTCNAHTDVIHPLRGERLPYVRACRFLFLLFSCWLCSFSVLPKAVSFFRLSLTRDSPARKVQVFKANITIQAEELVTQRERIFEASTHFKWHINFCSFSAMSKLRTSFCIPLNTSNPLDSQWTSGVQMNTELIPKAGQQNRSGTIPATKVTADVLQQVNWNQAALHYWLCNTSFIFRPISLNQLLPTV